MRNKLVLTLILAAIGGGAGALVLRSSTSKATAQASSMPPSATPQLIVAAGRTEPASEEIDVSTELDGRLRRVYVEEGQTVRRGQVIAELENADFLARVRSARALVAEREAALERAHNGSRPMQRREMTAQIREAEAVLENARIERQRRVTLLERGAISRSEFDASDREYRVAHARLEAVKERTALVEDQVRPEDRASAAAELDRARAQLAEGEAMLGKTYLRSPIDGIVLRKHKNAGESVSTQTRESVVTIGDCSRLRVRAEVDEVDLGRLSHGQRAWMTAPAYGDKRFPGRVVRIGQILGRKKVQTDAPAERVDTKVLETLIELDPGVQIPVGLRVDTFIEISSGS